MATRNRIAPTKAQSPRSNPPTTEALSVALERTSCALALVESARRALEAGSARAFSFGAQLAELGYSARELRAARRGLVELVGAAR